ncbi:MAG: diguanylate cyclase [Oscillospiraceae bacterium]|nr:diguanylate cyclase [Oscillospiraceae bacterium]
MLIPLLIFMGVSSDKLRNINYSTAKEQNEYIVGSEAKYIDKMFGDILADVNQYAENDIIADYAENAEGLCADLSDSDEYREIDRIISEYSGFGKASEIEILNKNGEVIYSTNLNDSGESAIVPDSNAVLNNGISSLTMYKDSSPAFSAEKTIYSAGSKAIGTVRCYYETDVLSEVVDSMSMGSYSKVIIMDSAMQIVESPYKALRTLNWSDEYSLFADELIEYVDAGAYDSACEPIDYEFEKKDKSVSVSYVKSSGYYVIGIVDLYAFSSSKHLNTFLVWIIAGIDIVLLFFAVQYILSPLKKLIEYLEKRHKGDHSAVYECNSGDEFSTAGYLVNSLIDHLAGSELRYRTIAEMTDNIVFEINPQKGTVVMSNNFDKKFSFRPKDNTLSESFFYKGYIYKEDKARFTSDLNKILNSDDKWIGEYRFKNKYGDFSWMKIRASKLKDLHDIPTVVVGVIVDIDREKESELNLIRKASYDALTQLYNRETFLKRLSAETEQIKGKSSLAAVMFVDLDDFKHFNDDFGHNCGDEVLKFTADTIKEICFERGFGGRFGGDEFIVCLTGLKLIGDAGKAAAELIETLGNGIDSADGEHHLSIKCSIGISFYGENGYTSSELISAADAAMYKIKKHGKSDFAFASAGDKPERDLESEFSHIDSNDDIEDKDPDGA